jgi:uncharacterized membrane protein
MMWYYGSGASTWMWVVGMLTLLVFGGGLAVLVAWAVTGIMRRREGEGSADEILKRRLAAGQISLEEYERTRRALRD